MSLNNSRKNRKLISEDKAGLSKSKAEVASEIGLNFYENQYEGKLSSGQNDSAGEFLVKHIIASNTDWNM